MVPRERLELSHLRHWLLRPACLPIPPSGRIYILFCLFVLKWWAERDSSPFRSDIRLKLLLFIVILFHIVKPLLSNPLVDSFFKKWWAERDSNPRSRRQGIYSPPHLATLESAREKKKIQNRKYKITASYIFNSVFLLFTFIFSIWKWSHLSDLNRRPSAYKAGALPAELKWHIYLPFWLRGKYYKLSNESQIFFRIFWNFIFLFY